MIVRKQEIKQASEEVSMQVSFGLPDVKKAMQKYYSLMANPCGHNYAVTTPNTEPDMLYFFEHDTFANYVQKYREQLSAWCFAMAVRHKFLISSYDEFESKKVYFLSEKLRQRVGRPRIEDED